MIYSHTVPSQHGSGKPIIWLYHRTEQLLTFLSKTPHNTSPTPARREAIIQHEQTVTYGEHQSMWSINVQLNSTYLHDSATKVIVHGASCPNRSVFTKSHTQQSGYSCTTTTQNTGPLIPLKIPHRKLIFVHANSVWISFTWPLIKLGISNHGSW